MFEGCEEDWNDRANVCIAITINYLLGCFTVCEGFSLLGECTVRHRAYGQKGLLELFHGSRIN
jgi:hypothetical protein